MKRKNCLSFKDIFCLLLMSTRRFFWRLGPMRPYGFWRAFFGAEFLTFPVFYFIQLCGMIPYVDLPFLKIVWTLINALIDGILLYLILFNPVKLWAALTFCKSSWWKNTGIRPSEIKSHPDLYGEYMATVALEANNRRNKVVGRIFNNVIVPKRGDSFTEIDSVNVNEYGIDVVEAKCRAGIFEGSIRSEHWYQSLGKDYNEMQNPFLQNQNHINYLCEYLYEHLPAGDLRDRAVCSIIHRNTVIMAHPEGFFQNIDVTGGPFSFYLGPAIGLRAFSFYKKQGEKLFTPDEVQQIAAILEPIASYTQEELFRMKSQREAMKAGRSTYHQPARYYIAKIEIPAQWEAGDPMLELVTVCRDNGEYKTYWADAYSSYYAFPNARIISVGRSTQNAQEVFDYYNRVLRGTQGA